MTWPTDNTVLVLSGVGIPPYSARGLSQTLEPISQASNVRRTINGGLVDFGATQFQKYKSTITGTDQDPPAFDALWPGETITVDCIAELAYPEGGVADRTVVASRTSGGFVVYRPRLTMVVIGFNIDRDEWGAQTGWSLELEEA